MEIYIYMSILRQKQILDQGLEIILFFHPGGEWLRARPVTEPRLRGRRPSEKGLSRGLGLKRDHSLLSRRDGDGTGTVKGVGPDFCDLRTGSVVIRSRHLCIHVFVQHMKGTIFPQSDSTLCSCARCR